MNLDKYLARINMGHPDSCWEWTGACNNGGYGTVWLDNKCYTTHRVMAWFVGLVPSPVAPIDRSKTGFVLHQCDNKKCCNPRHFTIGTYSQNQLEAYARKLRVPPKGHSSVNAKLTAEQAATIRKRYKSGELQVPLAKEYSVSQRVVSLITRGETYQCA